MATITEDYVSYEVAKLLKEKGFQQLKDNCGYFTTEMVYSINTDDEGEHHFAHQYPAGICNKDKYISCPTLQMAMKWLREVYNIHIEIFVIKNYDKKICEYTYTIMDLNFPGSDDGIDCCHTYKTYEQACEESIEYCLEHLVW